MTSIARKVESRGQTLSLPRYSQAQSNDRGRRYRLAVWLSLIGVLLPTAELSIRLGVNFPPGRLCMVLLFFPAIFTLLSKAYRPAWTDAFVIATVGWIIVASVYEKGTETLLTAAGGESFEFLAAYAVGRAFFGHAESLKTFIQVLKRIAVFLLILALADRISGQWITQDSLASLVNVVPLGAVYREGVVRATATLDHPILMGAFFSLILPLFLYSSESRLVRVLFLFVSLMGAFLSLSSSALLACLMILAAYLYDQLLKNFPMRWPLFWILLSATTCVIFLMANAPLSWMITHLTLDPQTGYFRYLIWNAAIERISQAPMVGLITDQSNNHILDTTVDCVWLAHALRFGIPMIAFLFMANITAIWPSGASRNANRNEFLTKMNTAFAITLLMFMFIGMTVHFWNYMWIFWGLCIGIKASLKDATAH